MTPPLESISGLNASTALSKDIFALQDEIVQKM